MQDRCQEEAGGTGGGKGSIKTHEGRENQTQPRDMLYEHKSFLVSYVYVEAFKKKAKKTFVSFFCYSRALGIFFLFIFTHNDSTQPAAGHLLIHLNNLKSSQKPDTAALSAHRQVSQGRIRDSGVYKIKKWGGNSTSLMEGREVGSPSPALGAGQGL